MKKIYLLLFALMSVLGMNAQQSWNFTVTNTDDINNIKADIAATTGEWKFDETNNRYGNLKKHEKEAIKANGTELNFTKGLLFTFGSSTGDGSFRFDVNKRMWMSSGSITIPGLTKGQIVTVNYMSSSKDVARGISVTNLTSQSGSFGQNTKGGKDASASITSSGVVIEDGEVTLTMTSEKETSFGMYIYSIKVANEGEEDIPTPSAADLSTSPNSSKNQAVLSLSDQTKRYYNTSDLTNISINKAAVTINQGSLNYTFNGQVTDIAFNKADKGTSGDITNAGVEITESKGWLESAYVKWNLYEGATSYVVYIKGGQFADYTKLDSYLVRNYGTYGRADMVGLKAGSDYAFKVVPVINEAEDDTKASVVENLEVKNYSREGFAFMNGIMPGAYKADGTLKDGAKVFYVTKNTAKTISTNVAGAETNPCVGLQAIIAGYEKGGDTTPIAFRFIGLVTKDDLDAINSKEEGIQIKGKKADSELNITIEGIGDDATIKGFGFLVRNSKSVEFRNFGIIRCLDDGISMDTDNSNIWVHHMDVFYGPNGGGDHAKGDGSVDVKSDSKFVTVSYNRFWDTGKTNMFGMKSESGPNYISYDHNWFDHSDSRHPRVRTMTVHVWNNYFDNVAKYGVGATTGSSVFVENNFFLKTKKPILCSKQGTDGLGDGTFSGEDGGMIKAFGNYFDRTAKNFSYYTQKKPHASTGYDAYETETRDEQVPATEKTLFGNNIYNNFDTNASLMYKYDAVTAEDVPGLVTGFYGAGRMNHGDFNYTFKDNVGSDDEDSAYDTVLGGLLDNYKTKLVGIFGGEEIGGGGSDEPGGGDQPGGGDEPQPEGTIITTFDASPSTNVFNVGTSEYGDGKITYNGTSLKKGIKLNSKANISFTPQKNYNMTIVLAEKNNATDVMLNGTKTTVSGTSNAEGKYYQMNPIALTAGTEYTIKKGTAEGILMVIILEPTE